MKSYVGLSDCFFCGESKEVLLDRRLHNSLPHRAVYNREPCPKCKALMAQGVMFISVRDGEPQSDNPYRSGRLCVIKEDAVQRMPVDEAMKAQLLKTRVCFIEDAVWQKLGFPTEDIPLATP